MKIISSIPAFIICLFSFYIANAAPPAPVPRTGQIFSHAAGDDGAYKNGVAWPDPRFTDHGNGTVTDNLTGLMWTKDSTSNDRSICNLVKRSEYAACLNSNAYLGYNDWRISNVREIERLVDISNHGPALPARHPFNITTNAYIHSSSANTSLALSTIEFSSGGSNTHGAYIVANDLNIWPVRSSQLSNVPAPTPKSGQTISYYTGDDGDIRAGVMWPNPRFKDLGNGTVTDKLTGLTWLKNVTCLDTQDWLSALKNVNKMSHGFCGILDGSAVGDWRLPNKNELWSLIDISNYGPALPSSHPFTIRNNGYYWSSSTNSSYDDSKYAVFMLSGHIIPNKSKGEYNSVWPVYAERTETFGTLMLSAVNTDFGLVPVGTTSAAKQIRLRNSGDFPLLINSTTLIGDAASQFKITPGGTLPCSSTTPTLNAGATCTMLVTVSPTVSGTKSVDLTFTTSGGSDTLPLTVSAISTVFGTITDVATGLPVVGATISINTGATVTSTASGYYEFGNLTPGTYTVTVDKAGYQTTKRASCVITLSKSSQANIFLHTIGLLNFTSKQLYSATAGESYNCLVMFTGGTAPYQFSKTSGSTPPGIRYDSSGVITGTPTGSGKYSFGLRITDSLGAYAERSFTIELVQPFVIKIQNLPRATASRNYSSTITASGGIPPYNYSITKGTLPSGMSLDSVSGVISGSPYPGIYPITISVKDSTLRTINKEFILYSDLDLDITNSNLITGQVNTPYIDTIVASGGYAPYNFKITLGSLPPGITLNETTGIISGIVTESSSQRIEIFVQDAVGRGTPKNFILNFAEPFKFVTTSLPPTHIGTDYSTILQKSGGAPPFSYNITSGVLPDGLSLDVASGVIKGKPIYSGFTNLIFSISDSNYPAPKTITKTLGLEIWPLDVYTTTVTFNGDGSGTITSDPAGISCSNDICAVEKLNNTIIKLMATPDNISLFQGWEGDCGGVDVCSLNLTANKTVTATFNLADKAKIASTGYGSFADAYTAANSGATTTIMLLEDILPLNTSINKPLVLLGGYLPNFSRSTSGDTTLQGVLNIGNNGSVVADRITLK